MRRILLDTSIFLWWLNDDERLPDRERAVLSDPTTHVWVSAVSFWEITIKKSLQKLRVPSNLLSQVEHNGFHLLPITAEHAIALERLPNLHRDPFDRMLVAQAKAEGLRLFTSDDSLVGYGDWVHLIV